MAVASYQWVYFSFNNTDATQALSFTYTRPSGDGDMDAYARYVGLAPLARPSAVCAQRFVSLLMLSVLPTATDLACVCVCVCSMGSLPTYQLYDTARYNILSGPTATTTHSVRGGLQMGIVV